MRVGDSVIGELTIVADDDAIVGAYFPGHWVKPAYAVISIKHM